MCFSNENMLFVKHITERTGEQDGLPIKINLQIFLERMLVYSEHNFCQINDCLN